MTINEGAPPAPNMSDKATVLTLVKKNGMALEQASAELKNDSEVVLAAVEQDPKGRPLQFASAELRRDKDFVRKTMDVNSYSIEFASEELLADRDFMEAIPQEDHPDAWTHASKELRDNKEFILKHTTANRFNRVSGKLRADKDVVLYAMRLDGRDLQFASVELCDDSEVVLEAVKQIPYALQYASNRLRSDRNFVLGLIRSHKQYGTVLAYASEDLWSDEELVQEAIKHDPRGMLDFAPQKLKEVIQKVKESS